MITLHLLLLPHILLLDVIALLEEVGSHVLLAHDLAEVLALSDGVGSTRGVAGGGLFLLDLHGFRLGRYRGLVHGVEVDLLGSEVVVMECG